MELLYKENIGTTEIAVAKIQYNNTNEIYKYLNDNEKILLQSFKSEKRKNEFLSIRKLIQHLYNNKFKIKYKNNGSPIINGNKYISISHSDFFVALAISNHKIGIDIEQKREIFYKVKNKFIGKENINNKKNIIDFLTIIWTVKESIYKKKQITGLSFKNNIFVNDFEISDEFYIFSDLLINNKKYKEKSKVKKIQDHFLAITL